MVSDGLESSSGQIQGMAAEVWSSVFCVGKLSLRWPSFLEGGARELGLCLAEAIMGCSLVVSLMLQLSYFRAAAEVASSLISSGAETA